MITLNFEVLAIGQSHGLRLSGWSILKKYFRKVLELRSL